MPTFFVSPRDGGKDDGFWVYGIDDWDARSQLASTLGIDAHDEAAYVCVVDERFRSPLNIIMHGTGERTEVPEPPQVKARLFARDGNGC